MEFSHPNDRPDKLGVITHGSLNGGVEMKLDPSESIENVVAGTFVVIQGEQYDFFSMITDVTIEAANENILLNPPGKDEHLLRKVMQGSGTYATVSLKPMLMMSNRQLQDLAEDTPRSVKTVPTHFSLVAKATEDDVARVFGAEANEGGDRFFNVGEPLGMDGIPVCIDLERLVERSNAVFGKTGTGKTFLTRLLLCGTIKTGRAVNLIFDMHSEYGWSARQESSDQHVQGLKRLFPSKVELYSLDPKGTRKRGVSADCEVYLYADQIEPGDVLPLRDTLNLTATAAESTYSLYSKYKSKWLTVLLGADAERLREIAEECGAHEGAIGALQRKLKQFEGYGFFKTESSYGKPDVIESMMESLERGKSIVFEFGKYDDIRVYLLVANVITRRLRDQYEDRTTAYLQDPEHNEKPIPLIITVEEAHKFLSPGIAHETPFGKIAREMRKFFVSLLVVDQRPSAIDEEVLSQIGTKIVAQLNDEKDIAAALVGTRDASSLRQVLASLDSKQQALILGHAVPMPIVVRTRTYDEAFYKAMRGDGGNGALKDFKRLRDEMQDLF
ncbi:MAG TPA: ATP-binding protein [Rhodothermales bacterium]|nr:ATP-binding protein [Rhodothermales bacterium]